MTSWMVYIGGRIICCPTINRPTVHFLGNDKNYTERKSNDKNFEPIHSKIGLHGHILLTLMPPQKFDTKKENGSNAM